MRTRVLSLFLVLSSATTAAAQGGWKEIGKTSAGNSVYVDPRSLRKSNGIVSARIRVKFAEPVSTPRGSWKTSQHLALFNCAKSTVAAKQSTYFSDEAGTQRGRTNNDCATRVWTSPRRLDGQSCTGLRLQDIACR
jgi:hypothetical protein